MSVDETAAPPPRRRVLLLTVALIAAVLAGGAGVVAYTSGVFDSEEKRFSSAPPVCDTIRPSAPLLGVAYTLTPNANGRSCELRLPEGHPRHVDAPKITVGWNVAGDADAAGKLVRDLGAGAEPLEDVGDEAYLASRNIYLRIGNLAMVVLVQPNEESSEYQVKTFAIDVAKRLSAI